MPVVLPAVTNAGFATDATSVDGRIRAKDDPQYGGVRIKIDYGAELAAWQSPFVCTVYRVNADGTVWTVRGGDPYLNYGGVGWLYDQEAPLGQVVSYYAVPLLTGGAPGAASASASILTAVPTGGYDDPDMWLVNLEDPGASVQARATTSLAGTYTGRNDKQVILGSAYPAVTPDTRNGLTTTVSVLTSGSAEFTAMQTLIQQSVILRKSSLWERPDGYFTVDDVSYTAQSAATGRGLYVWQMNLTEVNRPSTAGQTVVVPGYSYNAYKTQYPLYRDVLSETYGAVQGGNLFDTDTATFENGIAKWAALNGNSTISSVSGTAYKGTHSMKITAGAAGNIGAFPTTLYPASRGTVYTFGVWLLSPSGLVVDLDFEWKDGAGNWVHSDDMAEWGLTVQLVPNTWTFASLSVTPSSGVSQFTPLIQVAATAGGQFIHADAASVVTV